MTETHSPSLQLGSDSTSEVSRINRTCPVKSRCHCDVATKQELTNIQKFIIPPHLDPGAKFGRDIGGNIHEILRPRHRVPKGFVEVAVDVNGQRRRRSRGVLAGGSAIGDVLLGVDAVINGAFRREGSEAGIEGVGWHHGG